MSRLQRAHVSPARRPPLTYACRLARPGAAGRSARPPSPGCRSGWPACLLLLIHQATGSFAAAGAASGAFSAGTLTAPVKARLMDRRGQRVTLPLLGLGAAAALLVMALLGRAGRRIRRRTSPPAPSRRADAAGRGGDARPLGAHRRRRHEPGARLQPGRRHRGDPVHGLPAAGRAGGDRGLPGAGAAGHGGAAGNRVPAVGGGGPRWARLEPRRPASRARWPCRASASCSRS